jgi:hypothetical protein
VGDTAAGDTTEHTDDYTVKVPIWNKFTRSASVQMQVHQDDRVFLLCVYVEGTQLSTNMQKFVVEEIPNLLITFYRQTCFFGLQSLKTSVGKR